MIEDHVNPGVVAEAGALRERIGVRECTPGRMSMRTRSWRRTLVLPLLLGLLTGIATAGAEEVARAQNITGRVTLNKSKRVGSDNRSGDDRG